MKEISVIIPYFMGIECLEELTSRLSATLSELTPDWELVLVDDHSPDEGWELIKKTCAKEPRIRAIKLSRNYGQHPAISAGINRTWARWYVVMDCDLQDRPEDISTLYRIAIRENADIVIAKRESSGTGKRRSLGSRAFNELLSWASGLKVSDKVGNFRIFSHKAAEAYRQFSQQNRVFAVVMAQIGLNPKYVVLPRDERPHGESSYTAWKLISMAASVLIMYPHKPLRFLTASALLVTFAASALGSVYFVFGLLGFFAVQGFATTTILIIAFGGFQLLMMSAIGLNLAELLKETQNRPEYVIDQIIN